MAQSIDRRAFLKGASTTAVGLAGVPLLSASRASGADDRLVIAVGQWGLETPFVRMHLERIETPDKYTVVMHFKNRVWEVPSNFTQFVGYQNITSRKYLESVGEDKASLHPIGTGPFRHVEGKQGDYHRFEAVP